MGVITLHSHSQGNNHSDPLGEIRLLYKRNIFLIKCIFCATFFYLCAVKFYL